MDIKTYRCCKNTVRTAIGNSCIIIGYESTITRPYDKTILIETPSCHYIEFEAFENGNVIRTKTDLRSFTNTKKMKILHTWMTFLKCVSLKLIYVRTYLVYIICICVSVITLNLRHKAIYLYFSRIETILHRRYLNVNTFSLIYVNFDSFFTSMYLSFLLFKRDLSPVG